MKSAQQSPSPTYLKVAECLYRNQSSKTYFALLKKDGKQLRRSLKTQDRKLAERRLKELRNKLGLYQRQPTNKRLPFSTVAEDWFSSNYVVQG